MSLTVAQVASKFHLRDRFLMPGKGASLIVMRLLLVDSGVTQADGKAVGDDAKGDCLLRISHPTGPRVALPQVPFG